jgi:enterochelin esterase-like enzyme
MPRAFQVGALLSRRRFAHAPGGAASALRLLSIALALSLGVGCRQAPVPETESSLPTRRLDVDATTVLAAAAAEQEQSLVAAKRRELTWSFDEGAFGPTDVVISIPTGADAATRYPVLVALHGRGESLKGSRRGARGWFDDYELGRAMARLHEPPLVERDFEGYVDGKRLRQINRSLVAQPYAGLIVVCPFLPDVLRRDNAFKEAAPLSAFIVDVLLPRVYEKTPAIGTPATTGIDGVSLGGRAALLVGFSRPRAFGSIEALQAAIDAGEVERFAELGARALSDNPKLAFRLLTSDEDHFLRVNTRLSSELESRGARHRFRRVLGTHSYRFNRGPGSIEMLLYHDRILRGIPWD